MTTEPTGPQPRGEAAVRSPRRRPTLRDIGAALNISVNTVSRALRDASDVNPETRARVKAEAARVGYAPNVMARSLKSRAAMTLGLVITNPSNPFYSALISAVEQRGRIFGYSLLLLVTEEDVTSEQQAAQQLLGWGVDGALVVSVQQGASHWERLRDARIPLVLLNRDLPELHGDLVGIDYRGSAYATAQHLLSYQPAEIRLFEEDLAISPVLERIAGFRQALAEHGREVGPETILRVPTRRTGALTLPWGPDEAYHLARDMVADLPTGSALMAGSDYFALGIYRALAEAGRRAPDDVLVAGHGDHPFAAYLSPSLTSAALPAADVGAIAVDLLLERLKTQTSEDSDTVPDQNGGPSTDADGRESQPVARDRTLLQTTLVVRESSTKVTAARTP
jgi:LacI family transcriptional regulator